jgi:hypothetical protein
VKGLLGRPWARGGAAVLTAAVAVGGMALFGATQGHPAQDVRLLSGSAWLASGKVGQLTLLDGSSAEVAAQVQVAPVGNVLDVVQQGSSAYSVDQTTGTIRRVDGATFEVSPPEAPIPGATAGLTAFAGSDSLYVVDTRRGLYTKAEPKTGRALSAPINLPAQIQPNTTGIDDAGRLWIIDNATGDLTWVDGDKPANAHVAQPGRSILAIANGKPVVIDTTGRRAVTFDSASKQVSQSIDIGLRAGEAIQVSGSPHDERVYVVASRGVLTICEIAEGSCDKAVPLPETSNHALGAAVEAGNRLFVPNYTTGQVWIVDLTKREVVAKAQVLKTAKQFQLLTRDGVVFYNDKDSEQAGVIRTDGGIEETTKYDPGNPKKGLTTPVTGEPSQPNIPQQPQTPNEQQQTPNENTPTIPRDPTQPPINQPPVNPQDPGNPLPPPPPNPQDPPPPPNPQDPPPPNPNDPPPVTPPKLQITLSKNNPVVNEDISLKVNDDKGTAPTTATWDFADTQTGSGEIVTHRWATAKSYQVSVRATMPDGQSATTAVTVTVGAIPKFKLTVTKPPNGSVSGNGINCPPTCTVTVDRGTQITLTPKDNGVSNFTAWGGGCTGGAATCVVTMDAAKTVSATFTDVAPEPEDCVGHNPNNLTINNIGAQGFRIQDGDHWMLLAHDQRDANNALSVAKGYTQQCFIGRDNRVQGVMNYWKGGAGRPGPVSGEDCIPYDPATLYVVKVANDHWSLRSGNMLMEAYATQAHAARGMRVAKAHTRQCFIGRSNPRPNRMDYITGYWR